ncbi:MAG: hypothetical protein ABIQ70_02330 [Dokdonella sp.]
MLNCGLYIVTLRNEEPISVNRGDHRIEHRCIRVTRVHCKFGKARDFAVRERNYVKVFERKNLVFTPLFGLVDIGWAEGVVLRQLRPWRVRGPSGRRNEWLEGIEPCEVERIALAALVENGIEFEHLGSVSPHS